MLFIGKYNNLTIARRTTVGLFLEDVQGEEVLLPNRYVTDDMQLDDPITVFVYNDSEDRPVATTEKPYIVRNEFAWLEVKEVNAMGAFLDWGLLKDLFVPFREQPQPMRVGERYVVFLYLDHQTNRLLASAKVNKFLENERLTVAEGDEVNLLVWERTDLGYNVVVNNYHKGLVYHNEIFQKIQVGDRLKGFVKKIREENKLDISLQKVGVERFEPIAEKILELLRKHDGFLPLHDGSSPDEIYAALEMSKKNFKKSIGNLYKKGVITFEETGIRLV
ncbi:CvfB family protein [Arundinibacter roseus]|uniref:GntR family transcriptional regulator n=1 Tax=Arundinibacter roseus TaxID=2070510 RepID=A0A4V2X9Q3_9BACT|nr:S1-like domain-containing RNA-binding protein [Arundinibacter roseus]TDB64645.1 GntR family transcriptional regulator [Arundinibacter roseus]